MKSDALTDLIATVDDDSSPEHKAIYHLWVALDDICGARPRPGGPRFLAARGLGKAADALAKNQEGPSS